MISFLVQVQGGRRRDRRPAHQGAGGLEEDDQGGEEDLVQGLLLSDPC